MTKLEFLAKLREKSSCLPQNDIEERLLFYSEMIDDRIEEGLSQEDAVLAVGSVDEIAKQIIADTPLANIVKEKIKPKRRLKAWEIVLIVLGAPLWLPLLIAAFAVLLSLYVSLWSVIISLWAVFVTLAACALGSVVIGLGFAFGANYLSGLAMVSAGVVCAGLSIFMFFGCKAAANGSLLLTKKILFLIKKCFTQKEGE